MQRVAFQTVLREAAGLAGFTLSQLTDTPKAQLRTFINRRAREAWRKAWWAQLMHAELRYYRNEFDAATAYAAGDEVYYNGGYYRARATTTANLPTNATYWETITDLDAYVLLEQDDQEAIGEVRQLSQDNPLTTAVPRQIPFRLAGDRIWVLGENAPASVYVWFREPAPTWLGDDFSATSTYSAGKVIYYEGSGVDYEGDFWRCLATTTANQTPESAAAKWERIEFPSWLRECVAQAAYADWVRQDGNPEAARLEDAEAQRLLLQAIHNDTAAQRQITRSSGA